MSRIILIATSTCSLALGSLLGYKFRDSKSRDCKHGSNNINDSISMSNNVGFLDKLPLPIVSASTANLPVAIPHGSSQISPNRTSEIMRHGFPGFDNIRSYANFVLSYDRRNKTPHWVFEHLTKESVKRVEGITRDESNFQEDLSIHQYFRATNDDYRKSGYDRGHLAAAGNHRFSQKAMDETFFLSNIAPQVGKGFNRDAWNTLEKFVRRLTKDYSNIYVCTGPLYLPRRENDRKLYVRYEVIGKNHVAVPTHFFKVVVMEKDGNFELMSFVMPNQDLGETVDLKSYLCPIDSIERAAGLLFFEKIPRNNFKKINGR